ncbi:inositol phosphorylceramide synthase [Nocardia yunnanensis]|uniref:Inositol phosphorylceramide synthase n=1 Tax=Nocardia yunnanensis TaxID=2382165 RepID=A0A386ZPT6_9NOCA|nr:inositol phosphorylceramide synthase [Nocardia yunnanensis]
MNTARSSLSGDKVRAHALPAAALIVAVVLLAAAQAWASAHDVLGPLRSLVDDYFANPQSAAVSWAGLGLAVIGVPARVRIISLVAAGVLDLLTLALQAVCGWHVSIGTGPTLALTGLTIAVLRWDGTRRRTALHAIGFGALLVMASKLADTWLMVSIIAGPRVLDQYVQLADRALGEPAWLVGRLLDALGPVPSHVLHVVYIQLPVAAVVVAVWQLRKVTTHGWPRHHLVRTFLVLGVIGPLGYVLFPVVGPVFAYGPLGHGLEIGSWPQVWPAFTADPQPMLFDSVTARNCMPSMHTAWATALFVHSRTGPRWLRWAGAFWLVCTLLATLGFGYHYGSDLVAGAVLCLTVESALREPKRGWDLYRVRIVSLGAAVLAGLSLSYRFLAGTMAAYPVAAGFLALGALVAVVAVFYATWFARPGGRVAHWGGRIPADGFAVN